MRIVLDSDEIVAQRVLAIQRAAYAVEAELVGHDDIPPLHESLSELRARQLIFLGAGVDRVLAAVLAYERVGETVEIDRLAVDPPYFRRGLARRLLREVFVREREARRFTVATGAGNAPAIRLYEGLGFTVIGDEEPTPGVRIVRLERRAD